MERILLLSIALPIIAQTIIVCAIQVQENTDRMFGYRLDNDGYPTLFALFLVIVPGSFIIFSTVKFVKFVINFIPNALQKRKSKKERTFKEIEYKYDKLVKEAQNV